MSISNQDLLAHLNPQQCEGVCHMDGPLLLVAGAGSGKTRVLTHRVLHLIQKGVEARHILAVTFTNKAAQEMRERIQSFGPDAATVTTFHSLGLQILRQQASHVGLRHDFTIYDDQDQLSLMKDIMKELGLDPKMRPPKSVVEFVNRCKDQMRTPTDLLDQAQGEAWQIELYERYQARLRANNAVDFGDLIFLTVEILECQPDVAALYQNRFRYILVDEYQDTNAAQYRMIYRLAHQNKNIMVVGDPDQSIYEWRGADIRNILRFEEDFPGACVIRLEQNYRSTNTILEAANAIIVHNEHRKAKNLWSEKGDGEPLDLFRAEDERHEARYVLKHMTRLLNQGVSRSDMVIFYRTHAYSRVLEEEMLRNNLMYRIVGGVKFYARKEVKDLLAYLKLVYNPNDEVNFKRVVNLPRRGIGASSLKNLTDIARHQQTSLFSIIPELQPSSGVSAAARKGLLKFYDLIKMFQDRYQTAGLKAVLVDIMNDTGYVKALEEEKTPDAQQRLDNIREFFGSVSDFEESQTDDESDMLASYMEFVSLQTDLDQLVDWSDAITLMTLHSAKGLEFPYVFMVGMEEGVLPHINAINGAEKQLEEERRLCYVGLTRAQKKVFLSYAASRRIFGQFKTQQPSRFLSEIPDQYLNPPLEQLERAAYRQTWTNYDNRRSGSRKFSWESFDDEDAWQAEDGI